MESCSHITGDDGGEGCNSCESGWTMYLASPMHGDDDVGGSRKGSVSEGSSIDDGYGYGYIVSGRRSGKNKKAYQDYADADDDDSLASDASTGPAKAKGPSSPSSEDGGKKEDDGGSHGKNGKEDEEEEEDDVRTKFPTTSRNKKGGKVDKGGEGNSSKRGNSKRGSSSRRSFFLW